MKNENKNIKNETENYLVRLKIQLLQETRKKACESPFIPTVPGPVISPRTLTSEKAPLIIPKPSPDTVKFKRTFIFQIFRHFIGSLKSNHKI